METTGEPYKRAVTPAISRNKFRRHRIAVGIQQALRQRQRMRNILRLKALLPSDIAPIIGLEIQRLTYRLAWAR
jgi:hypothetical protein